MQAVASGGHNSNGLALRWLGPSPGLQASCAAVKHGGVHSGKCCTSRPTLPTLPSPRHSPPLLLLCLAVLQVERRCCAQVRHGGPGCSGKKGGAVEARGFSWCAPCNSGCGLGPTWTVQVQLTAPLAGWLRHLRTCTPQPATRSAVACHAWQHQRSFAPALACHIPFGKRSLRRQLLLVLLAGTLPFHAPAAASMCHQAKHITHLSCAVAAAVSVAWEPRYTCPPLPMLMLACGGRAGRRGV